MAQLSRARTLRLSEETDDALRDVAHIDGVTITAVITAAIEAEIVKRRADPAFGDRLRARVEADRQILDRLKALVENPAPTSST